jgi:branched-chain amino acid transport system ATP-binding protein
LKRTSAKEFNLLKLNNVDVHYGEIQVLREVSLNIEQGEIVSLLGSNGAGKSTCVNCISGVLPISAGQIEFMAEDISQVEPHKRVEKGLIQIPEGRRVFPTLSVRENLEMGSFLKKPKSLRQESMEFVMDMFPVLRERKEQMAGTLSGGEQQMLAIGRGLMSKPKLLILDEPSLGLAPLLVEEIFDVVVRIKEEGVTILLVEQNAPQALSISDRASVLEEGRIGLSGTGKELLDNQHIRKMYLGL